MPFEQIPYTNFHGTNQDWMIQQIKQMIADWASYRENLDAAWAAYQENLTGEWTDYQKNINSWRQALDAAFTELHTYVHDYFDNLDVQEEINNKLDEFLADGTLDAILLPYFNTYTGQINNTVSIQNDKISTLETRVNNFLDNTGTLGTEKDPELIDIRVGANGANYSTAGEAVRAQVRGRYTVPDPLNTFEMNSVSWAKGSNTVTDFTYPAGTHRVYVPNDYAIAEAGSASYSIFSFFFNMPAAPARYNIPKLTQEGETIDDLILIINTNKKLKLYPRLSTHATWGAQASVATSDAITVKPGVNVVNPIFTYTQNNNSDRPAYRAVCFQFNTPADTLDFKFDMYLIKGSELYNWIQDINQDVQNSIDALSDRLDDIRPVYDNELLFWGDSLTAGAGGNGTTFPNVCATILNKTYKNCGVGGENANTIAARQGGNNIIIPAGSINGNYPLADGFTDVFGGLVKPLLQGTGSNSGNKLVINGQECTLANSSGNYVISGYTGEASNIPVLARFIGSTFTGEVVVIFVGQNGSTVDGTSGVNARMAVIDSMISHIGHERYVILGLTSGTNASREEEDNAMLQKYGAKFLPTRKLLVNYGMTINGLEPTEQDNADIAVGTVPTSLRNDGIHMNAYGYTAIGTLVAEKIKALGYFN